MATTQYDKAQMQELLYQALETERGGIEITRTRSNARSTKT